MKTESILWQRLDLPGHEFCRLSSEGSYWRLAGTAIFSFNQKPCRTDYVIICDREWKTVSGKIEGWIGNEAVLIEISVDAVLHWRLNGIEKPEVRGCTDLDLSFSPSTNLLPIQRTGITIGTVAEVQAAWLRFPGFTLERLYQSYRRIGPTTYRYEVPDLGFSADLQVDEMGFIIQYSGLWRTEARSKEGI